MSLFNDERYTWRETYFVLFEPEKRPRLETVRKKICTSGGTLKLLDGFADPDGMFQSLTVASYEDHAALEINFQQGDAVQQEVNALIETLLKEAQGKEKETLKKARTCRAKFDLLHFEQSAATGAFQVVKRPELKFPPLPKTKMKTRFGGSFSNEYLSDKLQNPESGKGRFHFDPDSYDNCRDDGAGAEFDDLDSGETESTERIDPNTLVLVLGILCRLTDGIGIDPASGIIIP